MDASRNGKRSDRVAALRANLAHGEVTDERLSRLPSWARLYVDELESMALRSADRRLGATGEERTDGI